MIDHDDGSERRTRFSRHSLVMRDDFFRPLPVKSEGVSAVAQMASPEFRGGASEPAIVEQPTIIDESERSLTAGELYAAALSGVEIEESNKPRRRVAAANGQRIQLWGAGTSGRPRRGSRSVRLFRAQPEEIFSALESRPFGRGLQLDVRTFEIRELLDEPELRVEGQLDGAFVLRSKHVDVDLRAARFNSMFTAVEIKLTARRHPRRFFRAAHEAIHSLPLPGRT